MSVFYDLFNCQTEIFLGIFCGFFVHQLSMKTDQNWPIRFLLNQKKTRQHIKEYTSLLLVSINDTHHSPQSLRGGAGTPWIFILFHNHCSVEIQRLLLWGTERGIKNWVWSSYWNSMCHSVAQTPEQCVTKLSVETHLGCNPPYNFFAHLCIFCMFFAHFMHLFCVLIFQAHSFVCSILLAFFQLCSVIIFS